MVAVRPGPSVDHVESDPGLGHHETETKAMSDQFPVMLREPTKREWLHLRSEMKRLSGPAHRGEYQHNLISCSLRIVAVEFGMVVADQLIEEFKLEKRFGISPQITREVGKALES